MQKLKEFFSLRTRAGDCPALRVSETLREIVDTDAVYGPVTREMLNRAQKLQWIQSGFLGLERFLFPELVESSVVITNMRVLYGDVAAEHAIALMLALSSRIPAAVRLTENEHWDDALDSGMLKGCTIGDSRCGEYRTRSRPPGGCF